MKTINSISTSLILFLLLFNQAYANMGIPMIAIAWPVFFLALIPIIWLEWKILQKGPINCSNRRKLVAAIVSNSISTLVGIPLAWGALLALQMVIPGGASGSSNPFWQRILAVTVQLPWILPDPSKEYWLIPTAFILLLIPFLGFMLWFILCLKKGKEGVNRYGRNPPELKRGIA
jgi:hypothetical protein